MTHLESILSHTGLTALSPSAGLCLAEGRDLRRSWDGAFVIVFTLDDAASTKFLPTDPSTSERVGRVASPVHFLLTKG